METSSAHSKPIDNPPGPPALVAFLAEHDLACESCGYNLRGATTLLCPECGLVIPRVSISDNPPAPSRRLWCIKCKYPLNNVKGDSCPECGHTAMSEPVVSLRPRMTARFLPGAPAILLILAGAGLVTCLVGVTHLIKNGKGGGSDAVVRAIVGFLLALTPLGLNVGASILRKRLAGLSTPVYWTIFVGAIAASVMALGSASRLL